MTDAKIPTDKDEEMFRECLSSIKELIGKYDERVILTDSVKNSFFGNEISNFLSELAKIYAFDKKTKRVAFLIRNKAKNFRFAFIAVTPKGTVVLNRNEGSDGKEIMPILTTNLHARMVKDGEYKLKFIESSKDSIDESLKGIEMRIPTTEDLKMSKNWTKDLGKYSMKNEKISLEEIRKSINTTEKVEMVATPVLCASDAAPLPETNVDLKQYIDEEINSKIDELMKMIRELKPKENPAKETENKPAEKTENKPAEKTENKPADEKRRDPFRSKIKKTRDTNKRSLNQEE